MIRITPERRLIRERIAANIKAARQATGKTQYAMAQAAGLTTDLYTSIEDARTAPQLDELLALAQAHGRALADYLDPDFSASPQTGSRPSGTARARATR